MRQSRTSLPFNALRFRLLYEETVAEARVASQAKRVETSPQGLAPLIVDSHSDHPSRVTGASRAEDPEA
jgi:hypothetical protein